MTYITRAVTYLNRRSVLRVVLVALFGLTGAGCGDRNEGETEGRATAALPPTPMELRAGEEAFRAHCASCHGEKAAGTTQGPPLAHRIYEPSHHGDAAFRLAARNGVAAHHWRFGNMPPQPHVSDQQLDGIIGYVRWVQRQHGIE